MRINTKTIQPKPYTPFYKKKLFLLIISGLFIVLAVPYGYQKYLDWQDAQKMRLVEDRVQSTVGKLFTADPSQKWEIERECTVIPEEKIYIGEDLLCGVRGVADFTIYTQEEINTLVNKYQTVLEENLEIDSSSGGGKSNPLPPNLAKILDKTVKFPKDFDETGANFKVETERSRDGCSVRYLLQRKKGNSYPLNVTFDCRRQTNLLQYYPLSGDHHDRLWYRKVQL